MTVDETDQGRALEDSDWLDGLRYCHRQINTGSIRLFEALSYCYSLAEALVAKGVLGIEELEQRKDAAGKRIAEQFQQQRIGVQMAPERDKYNLGEQENHIDCQAHYAACRAICCKLNFALSAQDVEEGVVQWKLDQPYMIRQGENGYCIHLDQETFQCTVHDHRPAICRLYSCRDDPKVWLDYDQGVINPKLFGDEPSGTAEDEVQTED
jgi:Fe-S-cluster containining protein